MAVIDHWFQQQTLLSFRPLSSINPGAPPLKQTFNAFAPPRCFRLPCLAVPVSAPEAPALPLPRQLPQLDLLTRVKAAPARYCTGAALL